MRNKRRQQQNGKLRRRPVTPSLLHRLSPAQLRTFASDATREVERLQTQIKQEQATIDDLQQVLALIARLDLHVKPARGTERLSHASIVADVLGGVGRPMQLGELLGALAGRGVVIAGKTERARRSNLIITLGRTPLVRRVGHGLYALAEWRASA